MSGARNRPFEGERFLFGPATTEDGGEPGRTDPVLTSSAPLLSVLSTAGGESPRK
jgi:hypothetical protein